MTLFEDMVKFTLHKVESIQKPLPLINSIFFPDLTDSMNNKSQNFGLISLDDGSSGIVYTRLLETRQNRINNLEFTNFIKKSPVHVIKQLTEDISFKNRMIVLGTLNALSQWIMSNENPDPRLFEIDSFNQIKATQGDHIGMVGFFTPLVKRFKNMEINLTVIEKKEHLLESGDGWEVTLNPEKLRQCNKIIITATTILNDSLDEILHFCDPNAWKMIVGPTAGILPYPLFKRGIHLIGGNAVINSKLFSERIKSGEKWGNAVKKYCILQKY